MKKSKLRRMAWEYGIPLAILVSVAIGLVFLLSGCAAAQAPDGRVVVGWDVARMADTPEQILSAGAGFLPPPFNYLASAVIAGGGVGYLNRRARKLADDAFDEGAARAGQPSITPPVQPPAASAGA